MMETTTRKVEGIGGCRFGLNTQLADIQTRMQVHIPKLDKVCFALYDAREHLLRSYADSSSLSLSLTHYEAPLSSLPYLKKSIESRSPAVLNDVSRLHPSPHVNSLIEEGYYSSVAIPTFLEQIFRGFIFLNSHQKDAFCPSDIEVVKPYLRILETAIFSEYQLVTALIDKSNKLVARSQVYQKESFSHKQRVSTYTNIIALALADDYGFDDEFVEHLTLFSQYHDMGKVMVPPELLCKQQPLTWEETDTLRKHIIYGEEIVNQFINDLNASDHLSAQLMRDVVSYHYEFLDGSGYPHHLSGNAIPISAKIVCVANIFDALTTHKPYKQAWSVPYALLELEKMVCDGKLDADCVNALRDHQHQLKSIIQRYPERDPLEGLY
ncbi:HD domain-containing phosphohydrolase [Vibrio bivalvicida]|uniref:HD domain-containing phosphohydrolase n=1 Tax=Vibrio bivalvicida TaxID=1276888 RepID=A0ABV4MEQ6_9VIBR